jgi:cytochrome c551/c552
MPETDQAAVPKPVLEAVLETWGRVGEQHLIPIDGTSMLPLIRDAEQVLIKHGCANVRRGDVVVFRRADKLVAHRVLDIFEDRAQCTFITKGDNSHDLDAPVSANQVLGRVLAVKRGDRQMSLDTALWRGLGWVVASAALVSTRACDSGRALNRPVVGAGLRKFTALFHRGVKGVSWLLLSSAQAILGGWRA